MSISALLAISAFQICNSFPSPRDGPLGMEELNMLHADAVKFGAGADNTWFTAIDAKTLDSLITEMNEMNRWFAKVVKYWDDFTSGGDGKAVLEQNGKGIKKLPQDKGGSDAAADPAPEADQEDAGDAEAGDDMAGDDGAADDGAAADEAGVDDADAEDADAGTDGDEALTDPELAEGADDAGADGADGDDTALEGADDATDGDEAPTDQETEGTEDGGADTEVTDEEAAEKTEGGDDTEPGEPDEAGDGEGVPETDGADEGGADTDDEEEGVEEEAKPAAKPAKPAAGRGLFGGKRKEARRKRRN